MNLTISTEDGGDIPSGTQICVADQCRVVGELASLQAVSGAMPSGASFTFSDVPAGLVWVSVTDAAPYQDVGGRRTIVAGTTMNATVMLVIAGNPADPTPTGTDDNTGDNVDYFPTPDPAIETEITGSRGASDANGVTVNQFPDTGTGPVTPSGRPNGVLLVVAGIMLASALGIAWRQRRT